MFKYLMKYVFGVLSLVACTTHALDAMDGSTVDGDSVSSSSQYSSRSSSLASTVIIDDMEESFYSVRSGESPSVEIELQAGEPFAVDFDLAEQQEEVREMLARRYAEHCAQQQIAQGGETPVQQDEVVSLPSDQNLHDEQSVEEAVYGLPMRLVDLEGPEEEFARLLHEALERGDVEAVNALLGEEVPLDAGHRGPDADQQIARGGHQEDLVADDQGEQPPAADDQGALPLASAQQRTQQVAVAVTQSQPPVAVNIPVQPTRGWLNYTEMATALGCGLAGIAKANMTGHKKLLAITTDIMRLANGVLALCNHNVTLAEGSYYQATWAVADVANLVKHILAKDEQETGCIDEQELDKKIENIARSFVLPAAEAAAAFYVAWDNDLGHARERRCASSLGSAVRLLTVSLEAKRETTEAKIAFAGVVAHAMLTVGEFFK